MRLQSDGKKGGREKSGPGAQGNPRGLKLHHGKKDNALYEAYRRDQAKTLETQEKQVTDIQKNTSRQSLSSTIFIGPKRK